MSRAFTKEDREEAPLVIPRAPLPEGAVNYVTPRGLAALREELSALEAARARLVSSTEQTRTREIAEYGARRAELEVRIASAVPVEPSELPQDEIRFSAYVTLRATTGEERRYQIVGVDEAEADAGRIAYVAPLARVLLGKKEGDEVSLRTPGGELEFEVVAIRYDAAADAPVPKRRDG